MILRTLSRIARAVVRFILTYPAPIVIGFLTAILAYLSYKMDFS